MCEFFSKIVKEQKVSYCDDYEKLKKKNTQINLLKNNKKKIAKFLKIIKDALLIMKNNNDLIIVDVDFEIYKIK